MAVSYKKLWKLLIDRDMKKKDLCEAAGISHTSDVYKRQVILQWRNSEKMKMLQQMCW